MTVLDRYPAPPMTENQRRDALADMASIVRGEELDIPWRRVRILLDHKLAVVQHPVLTAGSRTSLGLTDDGMRFLGASA
ncbi:hypothetical protein [Ochrobactrum sp. 3-3]|uniref:hypothetical protein n=1 Tax=Ochrobactrum sp. 3-3 TaxID=1830124 RepID=UPI000DEFBDFB|nr:hypothetical protein [Ochrobactrum sp. 3-3]